MSNPGTPWAPNGLQPDVVAAIRLPADLRQTEDILQQGRILHGSALTLRVKADRIEICRQEHKS
jgi:hypothetical protein